MREDGRTDRHQQDDQRDLQWRAEDVHAQGFPEPNNPPERVEWVKELKIDQDEGTVRMIIEMTTLEAGMWALANAGKAADTLRSIEDFRDLLFADLVPGDTED